MRLFKEFSQPIEGGLIGYYRLTDWWHDHFTEAERRRIEQTYDPSGECSLTHGRIWETSGSAVKMLNGIVSHLSLESDSALITRVLDKSYQLALRGDDLADLHHTCSHVIAMRDANGGTIDLVRFVEACETQIDISPRMAEKFRTEFAMNLPLHQGFDRLATLRFDEGNYDEAARLCDEARSQGWNGDWERMIRRCRKSQRRRPDKHSHDPGETLVRTPEPDEFIVTPPEPAPELNSLAPALDQASPTDAGEMQGTIRFLQLMITERERSVGRLEEQITDLREQFRDLSLGNQRLEARLETAERSAEERLNLLRQTEANLVSASELSTHQKSELERVTGEYRALDAEARGLRDSLEAARYQADEAARRARALTEELDNLHAGEARSIAALQRARDEASELRGELHERAGFIAEAAKRAGEREAALESLRTMNSNVQAKADDSIRDAARLRAELDAARAFELEQSETLRSTQTRLQSLEFELSEQERVLAEARRCEAALEGAKYSLERELGAARAAITDITATCTSLEAEVESLRLHTTDEGIIQRLAEMEHERTESARLAAQQTSEMNSLRNDLESAERRLKSVAQARVDLEVELEAASGSEHKKTVLLAELRARLDASESSLSHKHSELDEARRNLTRRDNALQDKDEEIAVLRGDLAAREALFQHSSKFEVERAHAADRLREELDQARQRIAALEVELGTREGELAGARRGIEAHSDEVASERRRISALENQMHDAHLAAEEARRRAAARDETITRLQRELDEQRGQVQTLTTQRIELTRQLLELRNEAHQQAAATPQTPAQSPPSILSPDWEYDPLQQAAPTPNAVIRCMCPHCQGVLNIPKQFAGWLGQCKKCGKDIRVPKV